MSFRVAQTGDSRGTATVQLEHTLDRDCGSHVLRVACALWVYNCIGLPLALQESSRDDELRGNDQVSPEHSKGQSEPHWSIGST